MSDLPRHADVVFVGAGHNALVAAAYLLEAGRSVCLLEQMSQAGGFVRTEELGAPGFRYDRYSAVHPALVGGPVWAELGPDLKRHGLEYVTAPVATASSLPDGRAAVVPVDQTEFAAELDRLGETDGWRRFYAGFGVHLPALFGLFGDSLDAEAARATLAGLLTDRTGEMPFARLLTDSAIDLVRDHFRSEELRMLAAPWSLHVGASPSAPGSALWCGFALAMVAGGNPAPIGGSGRLADALVGLVTERGGDVLCDMDVDQILVRDGRAVGVRTSSGAEIEAGTAVIASTTPDKLYGRLLRDVMDVPETVRVQADGYRYRRGCFQMNLGLTARPTFVDERLNTGGAINIGRSVQELITSVRQAEDGLLPEHPSISWHEPTAVDPTRAPEGKAVVRLQILDAPCVPIGDAAGTSYGAAGWDRATAEMFADRVLAEAELHVPGLTGLVLERHITTPADLAAQNPNAGPGDSCAGDNSLPQALTLRPIPAQGGGYRTAVPGVWQIGAATWPGPGVGGASGRAVAKALIEGQ